MELEGFGASLIGRAIYVYSDSKDVWIPWEFVSGTQYTCKILITSEQSKLHCLEVDNVWTFVIRPQTGKDWSCIATIIRGMGGSVLVAFDHNYPKAPDTFLSFLDSTVADARIVITRIWFGIGIDIPVLPDAIFFPVHVHEIRNQIYDLIRSLPGRSNHGPFKQMSVDEWNALINTTIQSDLGLVISDIGEQTWNLFWHKISDSLIGAKNQHFQNAFSWLRTAVTVLEKNSE
jgi:hypothetical protein